MDRATTAARAGSYAQRLLENDYVQENVAEAIQHLRGAYDRAQKRRVKPARDERLRRQIREAALSIREAGEALRTGRSKPKRRRGRRIVLVIGLAAVGIAAALASSEELRRKLLGGGAEAAPPPTAAPGASDPQVASAS